MRKSKVKRAIQANNGKIIPAGSPVKVEWSDERHRLAVSGIGLNGEPTTVYLSPGKASDYLTGFKAQPSDKALERASFDGVCPTLTGARVEPDGYGPDGMPSWLVALGLI